MEPLTLALWIVVATLAVLATGIPIAFGLAFVSTAFFLFFFFLYFCAITCIGFQGIRHLETRRERTTFSKRKAPDL